MKRMCDKIVDCLDGEDEINCSSMRSTSSLRDFSTLKDSIFERKGNSETEKAENSSSEETSSHEESHKAQVETIHAAQGNDSKNNLEKESMVATVTQTYTTDTLHKQDHSVENFESTTIPMNNDVLQKQISQMDMSGPSTNMDFIEVSSNTEKTVNSNRNSFEFNLTNSEDVESITVDPDRSATNEEVENSNRGDMQSFTTSISKESLESRSSTLGNKELDIHKGFSDALNVNLSTSFTSTTTETARKHRQETLIDNTINQNTSNSNHEFHVSFSGQNQTIIANSSNSSHLSNLLENENTDMESKDMLIDLPDESATNTEDNSTESEAKHLIFFDNKGILDKIKDIIASQLQPAKQKIEHLVPNAFQCQR